MKEHSCEKFSKLYDIILSIDKKGKTTLWGSNDEDTLWNERYKDLDFTFCPYCGSKFD